MNLRRMFRFLKFLQMSSLPLHMITLLYVVLHEKAARELKKVCDSRALKFRFVGSFEQIAVNPHIAWDEFYGRTKRSPPPPLPSPIKDRCAWHLKLSSAAATGGGAPSVIRSRAWFYPRDRTKTTRRAMTAGGVAASRSSPRCRTNMYKGMRAALSPNCPTSNSRRQGSKTTGASFPHLVSLHGT